MYICTSLPVHTYSRKVSLELHMYDYVGGSAIICLSLNSQRENALGPPVSEAAPQLVEAILTCFFFGAHAG